jgi:hypothetical protein
VHVQGQRKWKSVLFTVSYGHQRTCENMLESLPSKLRWPHRWRETSDTFTVPHQTFLKGRYRHTLKPSAEYSTDRPQLAYWSGATIQSMAASFGLRQLTSRLSSCRSAAGRAELDSRRVFEVTGTTAHVYLTASAYKPSVSFNRPVAGISRSLATFRIRQSDHIDK